MDNEYDGEFDDDVADEVAQHESITQLDEWREEAKEAVRTNLAKGSTIGGISDRDERVLDDDVREELVKAHGPEIEELIEKLGKEKSELEARIELDESPAQADLDRLDALEDAISRHEHAIGA